MQDIVLNYDLPWTLIRLVQRVGRVDRIGQKSNIISSYFFFPEEGVDKIIALRRRLENRLKENQEVVGSDEKFFDEKEEIVLNSLYNEKSGILDDDDLGEIDLASYAYQIWKNAIDKNPKLKKLVTNLPDVVLSSKKTNKAEDEEGVLIYARTEKDNDLLTWISKDEKIITQSQLRILEAAACDKDEKAVKKMKQHHELVKKGIKHVQIVESETGGALGRKSSAKYRVWMRMSKWKEEFPAFITKELKNTLDDFYKYQLKTYAKDAINRQLRAGIGDADLADLLVTLREEDKLCIISKKEVKRKEPKIICSMGLIRE